MALTHYGKTVDNIVCLAGDNCPVNQSKNSWISFVGVWIAQVLSSNLNQAIKKWVMEQPSLLRIIMNISILMKKAGTLKSSAALRQYTPLVTITENVTQWSSQYDTMISFFVEIKLQLCKG